MSVWAAMTHVHHFTYGPLTPMFSYLMSCVGSALGLLCTSRARAVTGWSRLRWLVVAAISIGGTGIWVMHFIAMLGFSVVGSQIRYDVPMTLASMGVAVAIVGIGLFIVGFGGQHVTALLIGGVVTGLGVASMHYLGMAAVQLTGTVLYDTLLVVASIAIAAIAATVALWFTVRVRGALAVLAASLIMGVAVNGMHFTAMAAVSVRLDRPDRVLDGASALEFLLPLIIGIGVVTGVLLGIIAMSPSEEELRADAEWRERIAARLQSYPRIAVPPPKAAQQNGARHRVPDEAIPADADDDPGSLFRRPSSHRSRT